MKTTDWLILGAVAIGGMWLIGGGLDIFPDIGAGIKDFFDKLLGERAEPVVTEEWKEEQAAKYAEIEESMQRIRASIERVKGITERVEAAYQPVMPRVQLIETFQPEQITYETAAHKPATPLTWIEGGGEHVPGYVDEEGRHLPGGRI